MPRRAAWGWVIPLLLSLQLGLLWVQGVQIHRQTQLLAGLRADVRDLTDSLDADQDSSQPQDDSGVVPLRERQLRPSRIERVATLDLQDEKDAAEQELRATRDSERKAVQEAREAQSKISIQENARKAEEARKIQGATNAWQRWSLAALGLLVLAWIGRAYFRRR